MGCELVTLIASSPASVRCSRECEEHIHPSSRAGQQAGVRPARHATERYFTLVEVGRVIAQIAE